MCLFYFNIYPPTSVFLCSPGCPGSSSVDQPGLVLRERSTCICLSGAGLKATTVLIGLFSYASILKLMNLSETFFSFVTLFQFFLRILRVLNFHKCLNFPNISAVSVSGSKAGRTDRLLQKFLFSYHLQNLVQQVRTSWNTRSSWLHFFSVEIIGVYLHAMLNYFRQLNIQYID